MDGHERHNMKQTLIIASACENETTKPKRRKIGKENNERIQLTTRGERKTLKKTDDRSEKQQQQR